jgi:hypothetical protein
MNNNIKELILENLPCVRGQFCSSSAWRVRYASASPRSGVGHRSSMPTQEPYKSAKKKFSS